jgi:hypothetical protein
MFTYITLFFKSIYRSLRSTKEETDKKKNPEKENTDQPPPVPEIDFTTPADSTLPTVPADSDGTIKQHGYYTSSPFMTESESTPPPPAGNQYCLVAQTKAGQRACVLVDKPSDCQSGKLYATKKSCLVVGKE